MSGTKRPASPQVGGPPRFRRTSPTSGHNFNLGLGSGSNTAYMSSASTMAYYYILWLFEQFCREYREAHASYIEKVRKAVDTFKAKKHRETKAYALALQEAADRKRLKEAQQEKEEKLKAMAHAKLKAIEDKFDENLKRAESLATPEEREDAIRKASVLMRTHKYRAKQDARHELSDPAETSAIALSPEGEEINRKFGQMFQEAREDVNKGVTQIETAFINEIKALIAKQQRLSLMMDVTNLGNKGLVKLDEEEARASGMVDKTRNAGEIIESLHRNERVQPRVEVEGVEMATSGKGKGRA